MNQQLIPIIAAYWGAECSYEYLNLFDDNYTEKEDFVRPELLAELQVEGFMKNLKFYLRPLWSITEEELRELGELLYGELYSIEYNDKVKSIAQVLEEDEGDIMDWPEMDIMQITNILFFTECAEADEIVRIINHLRAKGFCVDQELVEANLVEWK